MYLRIMRHAKLWKHHVTVKKVIVLFINQKGDLHMHNQSIRQSINRMVLWGTMHWRKNIIEHPIQIGGDFPKDGVRNWKEKFKFVKLAARQRKLKEEKKKQQQWTSWIDRGGSARCHLASSISHHCIKRQCSGHQVKSNQIRGDTAKKNTCCYSSTRHPVFKLPPITFQRYNSLFL